MEKPAEFSVRDESGRAIVTLVGDWTANTLGEAPSRLVQALRSRTDFSVDIRKVRRLDNKRNFIPINTLYREVIYVMCVFE